MADVQSTDPLPAITRGVSETLAKKKAAQKKQDESDAKEAVAAYTAKNPPNGIEQPAEPRASIERHEKAAPPELPELKRQAAPSPGTVDRIEGDMAVVDIGGTTYNVPVAVLQALGIQAVEGGAFTRQAALPEHVDL